LKVHTSPPKSGAGAARRTAFCPYKGLASYYNIGDHKRAAWYYPQRPEVARISNLVSFEPDEVEVYLDGKKLALEPGQRVMPHGIDRGLDPDEILNRADGRPPPSARRFPTQMSITTSPCGREQQIRTFPSAGGSSGSGR